MNALLKMDDEWVIGTFNNEEHEGTIELKYWRGGENKLCIRLLKNGDRITIPKGVAELLGTMFVCDQNQDVIGHYAAIVTIRAEE